MNLFDPQPEDFAAQWCQAGHLMNVLSVSVGLDVSVDGLDDEHVDVDVLVTACEICEEVVS